MNSKSVSFHLNDIEVNVDRSGDLVLFFMVSNP